MVRPHLWAWTSLLNGDHHLSHGNWQSKPPSGSGTVPRIQRSFTWGYSDVVLWVEIVHFFKAIASWSWTLHVNTHKIYPNYGSFPLLLVLNLIRFPFLIISHCINQKFLKLHIGNLNFPYHFPIILDLLKVLQKTNHIPFRFPKMAEKSMWKITYHLKQTHDFYGWSVYSPIWIHNIIQNIPLNKGVG